MILEAHFREKRDILVSNDVKAFGRVGDAKRRMLEARFQSKIMTLKEFLSCLESIPTL
jgi:hypothetical protein